MLTLGAATIERIVDMDPFRLPLAMIFPDASLEELEDARAWLEPHSLDFAAGEVLSGRSALEPGAGREAAVGREARADAWVRVVASRWARRGTRAAS